MMRRATQSIINASGMLLRGERSAATRTTKPKHNFNFSPGPGVLPSSVMQRAQAEFCNLRGTGMGAIETTNLDATGASHPGEARGPVQAMMLDAESKLRGVLAIPDNYRVLFMHGGAVGQFSAVPLNLLGAEHDVGCDIINIGFWSQRTKAEAEKYCDSVHVVADCTDTIPHTSTWDVRPGTGYVHITLNETVEGLEFLEDPDWNHDVPLVADATSTLLSRPMEISKYGVIYASGGKNIPAGVTVVILREDLLAREVHPHCPQTLQYSKNGGGQPVSSVFESMPNTPPVFSAWMLELILDDIIAQGGLTAVETRMKNRAERLYSEVIDGSDGFYTNHIDPKYRSRMNAPFRIYDGDRDLERQFVDEASDHGLHYLFGHPVRGGIRATMYIGLPDEAIDALSEFMMDFQARHHNKSRILAA